MTLQHCTQFSWQSNGIDTQLVQLFCFFIIIRYQAYSHTESLAFSCCVLYLTTACYSIPSGDFHSRLFLFSRQFCFWNMKSPQTAWAVLTTPSKAIITHSYYRTAAPAAICCCICCCLYCSQYRRAVSIVPFHFNCKRPKIIRKLNIHNQHL